MYTPKIGDKGIFKMLEPFDGERYNKVYTVISLRSLKELLRERLEPKKTIYDRHGLTEEDFDHDLKNNTPIVVLEEANMSSLLYVPASKITSPPISSGVRYTTKAISVNLGLLPEELYLDDIVEDIKSIVKDAVSVIPNVRIIKTSDFCYRTYNQHLDFMAVIEQNPATRVYKSYKQKYKELLVTYNKLQDDYNKVTGFIGANFRDNIQSVIRPLPEDLKYFVKQIKVELVSTTLDIDIPFGNFRLFLYNKFNESPEEIYFTYFSKITNDGKHYKCFTNAKVNTDIIVTEGEMKLDSIFYIGSTRNYATFSPGIATFYITFDQPLNIRRYAFRPYYGEKLFADKTRITFYNEQKRPVTSLTYGYGIEYTADRLEVDKADLEFRELSSEEPAFIMPSV